MSRSKPTNGFTMRLARSPCRRAGFTLIELLMVISIIVILASVLVGVGVSLRNRSTRERTRTLIERVETALAEYRTEFGQWPNAFLLNPSPPPPYRPFPTPTGLPADFRDANASVAAWLHEARRESFDVTMTTGHIPEIVEYPATSGVYYVVDPWYDPDDPNHDLDASDGYYGFLNLARSGFNLPELDIWSNGPDGVNNRDNTDPVSTGDDIVNWGAR